MTCDCTCMRKVTTKARHGPRDAHAECTVRLGTYRLCCWRPLLANSTCGGMMFGRWPACQLGLKGNYTYPHAHARTVLCTKKCSHVRNVRNPANFTSHHPARWALAHAAKSHYSCETPLPRRPRRRAPSLEDADAEAEADAEPEPDADAEADARPPRPALALEVAVAVASAAEGVSGGGTEAAPFASTNLHERPFSQPHGRPANEGRVGASRF